MKEKGNRTGLFILLSAVIFGAGIFAGCYFIALSNRYFVATEDYFILDQWTKKVYDSDNGIHYYDLREMSFEEKNRDESFEEKYGISIEDLLKESQPGNDTIE